LDVHVAFLRTAAESGSAEGWRQELRRKYQRADLPRLRGSHAQRGLVTETLRAARRRTGNA
jgi:hypothetical protein